MYRKIDLNCKISIKKGHPVKLNVTSATDLDIYSNLNINCKSDIIAEEANNKPLDKERILSQLNKTTNSMYQFKNIEIENSETQKIYLKNCENITMENVSVKQ